MAVAGMHPRLPEGSPVTPAEYMRPFALEWSAERVLSLGPIVEHLGVP